MRGWFGRVQACELGIAVTAAGGIANYLLQCRQHAARVVCADSLTASYRRNSTETMCARTTC